MATLVINIDELRVGDLTELKKLTGRNVIPELRTGQFEPDLLAALVVISQRRDGHPDYSMEDANVVRLLDLDVKTSTTDPTSAST